MKLNKLSLFVLFICIAVAGCKKYATDYTDFLNNQEKIYPGLATGITYHPGNLRALLVWHPSPDPSIKSYLVQWNNGKDSMVVDAKTHNPADSIQLTVSGLNEYVYSFRIYARDVKGNLSIGQDLNNVRIYGPIYKATLTNRLYDATNPYKFNADGSVDLHFLNADSGNVYTNVTYINNAGKETTFTLNPDQNNLNLPNFNFGKAVTYQSGYIPVKGAVDTFKLAKENFPDVKLLGDVTSLFIKNPGYNFQRKDGGSGKWGLLKDWSYNTDVINKNGNTAGGFSTDDNGNIHMESSDDGNKPILNGKIWQSFTLPAGKYEYQVDTGPVGGSTKVNELVVTGTTLPDIDNIGTTLARFQGDQNSINGSHILTFTLTQSTTVAVGWVAYVGPSTYLEFRGVGLRKIE